MKKAYLIALFVFSIFSIQGQTNKDFSTKEEKINYFLSITDTLRKAANNPGLAISVIYEDEVLYQSGMGFRDVEKQLPVTNQTIFQTGSLAKAMTGFLAAQLVDEKMMDWNDQVKKYLPEFKMANDYVSQNVTVKDLLTHHTGLGQHYYMMYGPDFERNDILNLLPYMGLTCSLREQYLYNNFTYTIAGILEERVTNKPWEQLIQERIFDPLKMNTSYSNYYDIVKLKDVAVSYSRDGKTIIPEKNVVTAGNTFGPAGGLYSNIEDMTKWLQFLVNQGITKNDTLLSPKQFTYITNPLVVRYANENRFYGIGWDVITAKKYHTVSHNGVTAGQKARLFFIPDIDFGMVIMANQFTDLPGALTMYAEEIFAYEKRPNIQFAIDHFKNQSADKKNKTPLVEHIITDKKMRKNLKKYCGIFKHPAYGIIQVEKKKKDQLSFKYYDFVGTLKHEEMNNFTAFTNHNTGKDEFPITYQINGKEEVTGIEVKFPAAPKMVFIKQ